MMTIFPIALIFSSTVPLVTFAAFLFMALRHVVDCLQLLTYYRKEIDSSGRMISAVTNSALLFVMMYQLCMMAFFIIKHKQTEAMLVCLILVASTIYTVISYEEVYDLTRIDLQGDGGREFNESSFQKWKAEYEHPLVVNNVKRKAMTKGVDVKVINDWEQFAEDKDIQFVLSSESDRYRKSGFFQMSEEYRSRRGGTVAQRR